MDSNYSILISNSFKDNEGLVISPSYLLDMCFYGIPLCTPDGRTLSDEIISRYILSAQSEIERFLNLKLKRTVISEDQNFVRDEWGNWGFIRTTYPVVVPYSLDGYINTVKQIQYPKEWLSCRKTSDGKLYQRSLYLVPVSQSTTASQNSIVFSGITPHLGFNKMTSIPNYWRIEYGTGFDKIPDDIIKTICYMAAIPLYMWLGNTILPPGLNSQSISIDGLSQSRSIEAGGYTTKVKQLLDSLGTLEPQSSGLLRTLKEYYNYFTLNVC